MHALENNIHDTALIFEGGGMRASYTAAVVSTLLENGIYFDQTYGVSAGSSNAVNYLSRDAERARVSFTDLARDPNFGGFHTWLTHRGYFNASYIYGDICQPGASLEFDFATFAANPAGLTIEGFKRDSGETLYWTRKDFGSLNELLLRVQASSSLPVFMPPSTVGGDVCYDGGLGEGSGIMLPKAQADGFERYFVVLTRPKGFRKTDKHNALVDLILWRHPHVREALATRAARYNRQLDELECLVAEGRAYVFYAEDQQADSSERDAEVLSANYDRGYTQAQRELPAMEKFLQA